MHTELMRFHLSTTLLALVTALPLAHATDLNPADNIQVGPRPYYLVEDMDAGQLKEELQHCGNQPFRKTDFSIGHRGAALQFPEHTKESYQAAARMGAGIIECDVTFTKDKELVCRHSQCDLHTTTNIVATPLANKCSKPFTPAQLDASGKVVKPASAECCTSDITLAEFKTLKGKMDASNPNATTAADYLKGTANFRTDLYTAPGTLMTHQESIALFQKMGTKMTPELKSASVKMPFDGFTQQQYAQKMIDEYKAAGVPACDVFPQSFELDDILYWVKHESEFGEQAVYLDDEVYKNDPDENLVPADYQKQIAAMPSLKAQGVNYLAPPMFTLVELDANNDIVPSAYAKAAQAAGINLIAWTLERSYPMTTGGGWYYQTVNKGINNDGDTLKMLDVLAQDVGIKGIFSDWPATVTYYANCKGL
ncbi:MAG: glycerophosphodiester phosphodiesterase [Candidatus Thiothrix sulfatifontis]|nr:MAG: glycerophosphodiester phosphodiesterase [Candidatus Thiothrix sulfatifontis]